MSQESLTHPKNYQRVSLSLEHASTELPSAYCDLEKCVEDLSRELSESDSARARQRAEKEVVAKRLQNLLKVLPGGVVVLDGSGSVQDCNPAALGLLGEPLLGESWREVVRREFAPRWDDGHDITLRNGRCVNISTQALVGEPGQIVLINDVTETRELQAALNRYRRLSAKGEMAASLAHQIRTPLSSAVLYLSNLSRGQLDEATRQRFTRKALTRLRHLEQLVDDMLVFARGGSFDAADITVRPLLEGLAEELHAQMRANDFQLEVINQATEAVIHGNRDALLSVLQNLATNAVEACGKGGKLVVTARVTSRASLEITCADNGPGIASEIREKIFEPFVTTRAQGTGLGLAVARVVIQAHGGNIRVASNEPKGTVFLIELPIVAGRKVDERSAFEELR
jgi:two-component system sensor histidine kinase FlrB